MDDAKKYAWIRPLMTPFAQHCDAALTDAAAPQATP
jgi:hypothetical protein